MPREGKMAGENYPLRPTLILRKIETNKQNFLALFYLSIFFATFFEVLMLSR